MKYQVLLLLLTAGGTSAGQMEALYAQHCQTCHGADRQGSMGPALLPESLERLKPAEIEKTIRLGRQATQMQAFAGQIDETRIRELAAWLLQPSGQAPHWTDADMRASHHQFVTLTDLPAKPVHPADPHNLFVVVEAGDHHVSIVDGDRFTVLARFASHYALHGGPKFSPDGRFVYFASRDGWVTQYDLYSLQIVADIRVGLNTRNIAVSADGRWVLAGNTLPTSLVLLRADGLQPEKNWTVRSQNHRPSRVSAVYDAAPRNSFVVALKDVPELWEIPYSVRAEPLHPDLVHDYRMVEGAALPSYLNPQVIPLDMVLDDFFFDPEYRHVLAASRDGQAQVISLDSRSKVADLPLGGMPHLGSGIVFTHNAHRYMATPDLKAGRLTFVDMDSWQVVKDIALPGAGFFLRSHENTPYAWADSMMSPRKDTLSIIDKRSLEKIRELVLRPGKTTAHVEFTRDGLYALVSVMEDPGELIVVDGKTFKEVACLKMAKPVGKYNVYNKINRSQGTSH
ncbi:cytochrome D1 domain-containing protein [Laribacter hongkongensis]|uniref:Cytochrome Cbb3 n=1 Tax=Laribacter hongkongensis TaxID=168471 RepID=A0A248LI91_9NEIS|nr:cytochrome D1 domain-containing protein [Laribacter hongkongensis]ASJ24362.1 cytochrome Cbb3 [Laribacter hongkongensis]MCG9042035.1 nitrite reductase [Laribacter hongkongensis]MCG9069071.1 nitrite reductase [Laribacter hongkongensis]MCG9087878.1 nitrite reductase [Laribacter hongkongensis]MCG9110739.1 nitrite reductase [Laribacter hongkongensis]